MRRAISINRNLPDGTEFSVIYHVMEERKQSVKSVLLSCLLLALHEVLYLLF